MIKEEYKNLRDDEFVPLTCVKDEYLGKFMINKLGQVKNLMKKTNKGGLILKVTPRPNDYPVVTLGLEKGDKLAVRIHLLLAKTFLENDDPENKVEVDHIDRDISNYKLDNLRWVTKSENKMNRVFSESAYTSFRFYVGFLDEKHENYSGKKPVKEDSEDGEKIKKAKGVYDGSFWKLFRVSDEDLFEKFIFPTDFKEIPNSNDALCSSQGLILLYRMRKVPYLTRGYINYAGYRSVNIKKKLIRVHRLVYSLFGSEELKDTDLIDHIDTDRGNNRIGNLKKVESNKENLNNPLTIEKRCKKVIKLDLEGNFLEKFNSCQEAILSLGGKINNSRISAHCKDGKPYAGFRWKYEE